MGGHPVASVVISAARPEEMKMKPTVEHKCNLSSVRASGSQVEGEIRASYACGLGCLQVY
jgi:hypothetical protein